MATKQIPFSLEMVKKIQAGEIKGTIKTRDGRAQFWRYKQFKRNVGYDLYNELSVGDSVMIEVRIK